MSIPASQIGFLSVRQKPQGGGLLDSVKELDPKIPVAKSDIIILVHGYNVDQEQGNEVYKAFLDKFGSFFPNGCPYNIFHFYWSGDVKNKVLSALSYPWEIPVAKEAGSLLFTYLQSLQPIGGRPLRIYFVCHSLGNRLVLEEISKQIQNNFSHRIVFYTGMASAVPVYMVGADEDLYPAASLPDKTLILYSTSDPILHWAFPAGQTAAGEGFFPEAIGRNGNPEKYLWKTRIEMRGYVHGDYWNGDESTSTVGSTLGIPVPNSLPQSGLPSRSLPDKNSLPTSKIGNRVLLFRNLIGT